MNDLHEEATWAPPRLASDSMPTVSEDVAWDEDALERMKCLEAVRGFRAAYSVNSSTKSRSPIIGEKGQVSEEQFIAATAAMRVPSFDNVLLTLDRQYVLVRASSKNPDHACVLVLDRAEGNPAIASVTLKTLCEG